MRTYQTSRFPFRMTLPFGCLLVLLGVLWIAGGASRSDVFGQMVVRAASAVLSIIVLLFGSRADAGEGRPVLILVLAGLALTLIQLVPLPPAIWQALPGRELFAEAAAASGQPQPWRPWSIVPGATVNAAASLIVPLAVLLLTSRSTASEHRRLPGILLVFIAGMTIVGLLQFSGAGFNDPLVNGTPGEVGGTFANRNHFALLLAIGCVVAPVWAFLDVTAVRWRVPTATGLLLLFGLTLLASGSRAGLALGIGGLGLGLLAVRGAIGRELRGRPRWVMPAVMATLVALVAAVVIASIVAGRAASIDRVFAIDIAQDMRQRGLPTVLSMIRQYFPLGTGFGSFDPLFRVHEPFVLLKPTYFNHAHNDWLEIVLEGGLAGAALLAGAVMWWAVTGLRAWRQRQAGGSVTKAGWSVLLLVMGASLFDYPARTPTIMAIMVIAGLWLEGKIPGASALPDKAKHL